MTHKLSWNRAIKFWFWKGQFVCRFFGHRANEESGNFWCPRCNLAYEEFTYPYGLQFWEVMRKTLQIKE